MPKSSSCGQLPNLPAEEEDGGHEKENDLEYRHDDHSYESRVVIEDEDQSCEEGEHAGGDT